tara:strand:- start:138 stop:434 length:297 start_codon:yes stop_codon:yes gene_type:complete
MELKKATIRREDAKTSLILHLNDRDLEIVLTDDNPNNVKSAFNVLLQELKTSKICFELEDNKSDLYYHICKEYLDQLNMELTSVHAEMLDYGLITEEE